MNGTIGVTSLSDLTFADELRSDVQSAAVCEVRSPFLHVVAAQDCTLVAY